MIIVDASLVVDIVLMTPVGLSAQRALRQSEAPIGAPELLDVEVTQVLRRCLFQGQLSERQADAAMTLFAALPVERFGHRVYLDRIWALRNNLSAYDAAYVALAELLEAPLWTRDAKLKSAPGHQARIEVV